MTIREPVFDNPVARDRMPRVKPPFELPAITYLPTKDEIGALTTLMFITICGALMFVYIGRVVLANHAAFHFYAQSFATFGMVLLTLALMVRPLLRVYGMPEAMAVLGFVECSLVLADTNASLKILPIMTGILLAWAICEIALHSVTINPLPNQQAVVDPRFVFVAALSLIHAWVIARYVLEARALVPLYVVCVADCILTGVLHFQSGYRFLSLVKHATYSYFNYPESDSLSPGLIASTAGRREFRLLPITSFLFAFIGGWILTSAEMKGDDLVHCLVASIALASSVFSLVTVVTATPANEIKDGQQWQQVVDANRRSGEAIHNDSIFIGTAAADGSPVQVDRSLVMQHVHFLGSTGSGKTSNGLIPLLEQLIRKGDASVIVLDLKGDTLELLASMEAVRTTAAIGKEAMALSVFSTENGTLTNAFNPFLTRGWAEMSDLERTDVICSALGLDYGSEYGRAFFTACNSVLILTGNFSNPDAMSFRQLLIEVEHLLKSQGHGGLPPEIAKAGVHAWAVLSRMAMLDALNVTSPRPEAPNVLEHQIDLAAFFVKPQLAYFKLPSTTSSVTAPAVGRLVASLLLVAGQRVKRSCKVYLVIDEFQMMAAESLSRLFQMGRSLDIGLILANQTMTDLYATNKGLASSVESNCHWRQWFSVSDRAELEYLEKIFGTREETKYSTTYSQNGTATTARVEDVPRAAATDLQSISADPHLSILRIEGDRKGYGQYRGIPFVVRSEFHISSEEYQRRREYKWPGELPGMIRGGTTMPDTKSKRDIKDEPNLSDFNDPEPEGWDEELFE